MTLLGIAPREMMTYVHTKTRRHVFTAAFFVIAKDWTTASMSCNRWTTEYMWQLAITGWYPATESD